MSNEINFDLPQKYLKQHSIYTNLFSSLIIMNIGQQYRTISKTQVNLNKDTSFTVNIEINNKSIKKNNKNYRFYNE